MERLDFSDKTTYDPIEAAIHLNRYTLARPFCKDKTVLDAACGNGYGSYLMKTWGAHKVCGVDIDVSAVQQAQYLFKADGLSYQQSSVENLPFEDNSFDLVVSLETIEHVDDAEAFLREIKRVLKPGGCVVLSCPNDPYYYEKDGLENPFHKRTYTFFEFKEQTEKYLGSYVDYFLSFALEGFINVPYERQTLPESAKMEDALGMLHYRECDSALCVPWDRYLNHWNANYYVGVWGGLAAAYQYSAVVAPRETFIDHKDIDYDLLWHLDESNKATAAAQNQIKDLESQLAQNQVKELERQLAQNQVREQELELVKNQIKEREEQLVKEYDEKDRAVRLELERIKILHALDTKENELLRQAMQENIQQYNTANMLYQQALARIADIESSRGVRLLGKLYSVRSKIKSLFTK